MPVMARECPQIVRLADVRNWFLDRPQRLSGPIPNRFHTCAVQSYDLPCTES